MQEAGVAPNRWKLRLGMRIRYGHVDAVEDSRRRKRTSSGGVGTRGFAEPGERGASGMLGDVQALNVGVRGVCKECCALLVAC